MRNPSEPTSLAAIKTPISQEALDQLFRETVSAIDAGDVSALEQLLAAHPRLVRERLHSPGDWLRELVGLVRGLDRVMGL